MPVAAHCKLIGWCFCFVMLMNACTTSPVNGLAASKNSNGFVMPDLQSADTIRNTILLDKNSAAFKFFKKIVLEEANGAKHEQLQLDSLPFFIKMENENDPYTVYFSPVAITDLNNDNLPDYIVERSSQGMLGGNANTNSELIYYIMKDSLNETQKHSILMYAPFSYNVINDYRFKDGTLSASAIKNFRTYYNEGTEDTKALRFIYKDNNLYEESYLSKCGLAEWKDKKIFKMQPGTVKRSSSIDMHNFTETLAEQFVKDDTSFSATFSGCDNAEIYFDIDIKNGGVDTSSAAAKKELLIAVLNSLKLHTNFHNEFKMLISYYGDKAFKENAVTIDPRLEAASWVNNAEGGNAHLRINLSIIHNPKQKEHWEILNRIK